MKKENFTTICKDGVELKGILLLPENPKAIVQFNCGTGAKKEYYLPFVEYLAKNDFLCCLWDYRGIGASRSESLKSCAYIYTDYGTQDMPAVKAFLQNKFPDLPLLFFGHSAGGQQVGFMDDLQGIRGVVSYAVSAGYYKNMPWRYFFVTMYFFWIFAPLSIFLSGYVQAKKFNLMEDLPKKIVLEWRDWCMNPRFFLDDKFYGKSVPLGEFHDLPFPMHTFWSTDDDISNEKNTKALWERIHSKHPITFTKLEPKLLGIKQIGHFGFFKRQMEEKLWTLAVEKLNKFLN